MTPITHKRLPFGPMKRIIDANSQRHEDAARALGVTIETLRQRLYGRTLDLYEADRVAVAFGHHPCEVWGELWWEASASRDEYAERRLAELLRTRRGSLHHSAEVLALFEERGVHAA
jgi:hypothetical protein